MYPIEIKMIKSYKEKSEKYGFSKFKKWRELFSAFYTVIVSYES